MLLSGQMSVTPRAVALSAIAGYKTRFHPGSVSLMGMRWTPEKRGGGIIQSRGESLPRV